MTQKEIIEMARQAGFVDYELDDGTTNAFDKRYEAFAKLIAEKAIKEALAQPEQESVGPEYIGIPVAYQYLYSDGSWRCSFGDQINGSKPIASRALYARKDGK